MQKPNSMEQISCICFTIFIVVATITAGISVCLYNKFENDFNKELLKQGIVQQPSRDSWGRQVMIKTKIEEINAEVK